MRVWFKTAVISALACTSLSACQGNSTEEPSTADSTSIEDQLKTPFLPPEGKQLMIIGQDSDTISEYIANMPEDNIEGVTLYSQLKTNNTATTLKGIYSVGNWQSGKMSFTKTLAESPNAALAIGLAIDTCNQDQHPTNIANGLYDDSLDALTTYLAELAPRKVFLRIGYEFDGPWNCYEPKSYKQAFRYISNKLDEKQVNNVATVWQSATWPDSYGNDIYDTSKENHWQSWYPGSDVVDYVGVSVFYRDLSNWNYTPPTTPDSAQTALLDFARNNDKPVMIAEAAPQGYRIEKQTQSPIQENKPVPVNAEYIWDNWYQPFFDFIYQNNDVIRVVAYINTHWESQGMWQCQQGVPAGQPGCAQGNWGDTRVHANEYIRSLWLSHVNDKARWVQTGEY